MTISSQVRKAGPFTGNDATTVFAFAFKVFSTSDVLVTTAIITTGAETVLTLTSDYTVTLNGDQDAAPGGTITLLSALPSTKTMVITSKVDYLQAVQLTNAGGFYPSVINAALDRLTILAQQLQEKVTRAVTVPVTSTTQPADLIASVLTSANQASLDAAEASAALAGINASTIIVNKTSNVGSAQIPNGTTAQRGTPPAYSLRGNSDYTKLEFTPDGTTWSGLGGASGSGGDAIFWINGKTITTNHTILSTENAGTFGPVTIADGVTVTLETGSTWSIV